MDIDYYLNDEEPITPISMEDLEKDIVPVGMIQAMYSFDVLIERLRTEVKYQVIVRVGDTYTTTPYINLDILTPSEISEVDTELLESYIIGDFTKKWKEVETPEVNMSYIARHADWTFNYK